MNKFKQITLLLLLLFTGSTAFAQDNDQRETVEMATGLYQSGKIYVVIVVMSVIFTGIAAYLVILDRKISKLEKEK